MFTYSEINMGISFVYCINIDQCDCEMQKYFTPVFYLICKTDDDDDKNAEMPHCVSIKITVAVIYDRGANILTICKAVLYRL